MWQTQRHTDTAFYLYWLLVIVIMCVLIASFDNFDLVSKHITINEFDMSMSHCICKPKLVAWSEARLCWNIKVQMFASRQLKYLAFLLSSPCHGWRLAWADHWVNSVDSYFIININASTHWLLVESQEPVKVLRGRTNR